MNFTKEELTTIERLVDNASSEHCKGVAQQASILMQFKKGQKLLDKQFDNHIDAWDKLRTISAKCSKMKGETK